MKVFSEKMIDKAVKEVIRLTKTFDRAEVVMYADGRDIVLCIEANRIVSELRYFVNFNFGYQPTEDMLKELTEDGYEIKEGFAVKRRSIVRCEDA